MGPIEKPKPTYLLPLVVTILNVCAQEWAAGQDWHNKVPFGLITSLCLAFLLGLVAQDIYNPHSWIRQNFANWQRSFVLGSGLIRATM